MRLDPITLSKTQGTASAAITTPCLLLLPILSLNSTPGCNPFQSGAHSVLEPPLPIPNRTVKHDRANDSEHLARESRSAPDYPTKKRPTPKGWAFCFMNPPQLLRYDERRDVVDVRRERDCLGVSVLIRPYNRVCFRLQSLRGR